MTRANELTRRQNNSRIRGDVATISSSRVSRKTLDSFPASATACRRLRLGNAVTQLLWLRNKRRDYCFTILSSSSGRARTLPDNRGYTEFGELLRSMCFTMRWRTLGTIQKKRKKRKRCLCSVPEFQKRNFPTTVLVSLYEY